MEKYRVLERYPDYEISDKGNLRRKETKKQRRHFLTNGHPKVIINGKTEYISRLVAETFLEPVEGLEEVAHIDGDKENNEVTNIEWSSHSDIQKRSFGLGINAPGGAMPAKRILVIETGEIYPSIRGCARALNISASGIRQCLNGEISNHKGFTFRHVK